MPETGKPRRFQRRGSLKILAFAKILDSTHLSIEWMIITLIPRWSFSAYRIFGDFLRQRDDAPTAGLANFSGRTGSASCSRFTWSKAVPLNVMPER
jgi:hypothetical protein